MAGWGGRLAAVGVALLSLIGAGFSMRVEDVTRELSEGAIVRAVPVPAEYVPDGVTLPPEPPRLTPAQHKALGAALWRDPLDQGLFNLLYVDAVLSPSEKQQGTPDARLLSALGWRHTPAQQNLILRAALLPDNRQVVDRVDGLLRRQKVPEFGFAMLNAMEAIPEVQGLVEAKLRARPGWRADYLSVVPSPAPPELLTERARTLRQLSAARGGISRAELAPLLRALTAAGRTLEAYALWTAFAGTTGSSEALYDPQFRQAARQAGLAEIGSAGGEVPFEWRFYQGPGFSAEPVGDGGVALNWDGRGVPVFLTQLVPVAPGQRYVLALKGPSGSADLKNALSPSLACGTVSIDFVATASPRGEARFRSDPLPKGCEMGAFTIAGAIGRASRPTTVEIGRASLMKDG